MNLNVDPRDLFGADLSAVFGPKASRTHIKKLTHKEISERLSKVPEYVPTEHLGLDATMFEVVNTILLVAKRTKAFWGIDLDWCTDLNEKGLVRPKEGYKPVSKSVKNNKAQRGIQMRHLFGDIVFKFNPEWVQTGLARYNPITDVFYINDAQHRFCACIILGIRHLPLEYKVSVKRSDDVKQYTCVNLGSLVASEFDKYRTMVEAMRMSKEEGEIIDDPDYLNIWELHTILTSYGCKIIEKNGEDRTGALECTGPSNMRIHFRDYGSEIFTRAISIYTQAWPKAILSTQNIWGICEFLKLQQDADVLDNDAFTIDMGVTDALTYQYPQRNRNGFYKDAVGAIKRSEGHDLSIPYQSRVAAGIEKVIKVVHPEVDWAEVKFGKTNISDNYMDDFEVVPLELADMEIAPLVAVEEV